MGSEPRTPAVPDRTRVLRLVTSTWDAVLATSVGIESPAGDQEASPPGTPAEVELAGRLQAARAHLSAESAYITETLDRVDDAELHRLVGQSTASEAAIARVMDLAQAEGGLGNMLKGRLLSPPVDVADQAGADAGAGAATLYDVTIGGTHISDGCLYGAAAIASGAIAAAVGLEIYAGFALTVGVEMVAASC